MLRCSQMKQRKKIAIITLCVASAIFLAGAGATYGAYQYFDAVEAEEQSQANIPEPKVATREELLSLVNTEREKAGVPALVVDERVQKSAQLKSDDMVAYDYKQHIIPRYGKLLSPEMNDLLVDACSDSSENFYFGNESLVTSKSALHGWMNSPAHKQAILDPKYTSTGFGVSMSPDGFMIAVQHFCIAK